MNSLLLIDALGWILILAGSFFLVTGAIGLIRFPDFWSRLHAVSVLEFRRCPASAHGHVYPGRLVARNRQAGDHRAIPAHHRTNGDPCAGQCGVGIRVTPAVRDRRFQPGSERLGRQRTRRRSLRTGIEQGMPDIWIDIFLFTMLAATALAIVRCQAPVRRHHAVQRLQPVVCTPVRDARCRRCRLHGSGRRGRDLDRTHAWNSRTDKSNGTSHRENATGLGAPPRSLDRRRAVLWHSGHAWLRRCRHTGAASCRSPLPGSDRIPKSGFPMSLRLSWRVTGDMTRLAKRPSSLQPASAYF